MMMRMMMMMMIWLKMIAITMIKTMKMLIFLDPNHALYLDPRNWEWGNFWMSAFHCFYFTFPKASLSKKGFK